MRLFSIIFRIRIPSLADHQVGYRTLARFGRSVVWSRPRSRVGGASRGTHMYEYESGASSTPRTDSEGRRVFGMNIAVSKCNRERNDFDY